MYKRYMVIKSMCITGCCEVGKVFEGRVQTIKYDILENQWLCSDCNSEVFMLNGEHNFVIAKDSLYGNKRSHVIELPDEQEVEEFDQEKEIEKV